MMFHKPRLVNLLSYILFAASAVVLVVLVAFTMQVDVLKNWKLELPSGPIHAGDTIVVQSTYTKVRAVTGVATRYLECASVQGAFIRYPINQATADRAPGVSIGTGVVLKIPETVPGLPAQCRISINVRYQVYPWRAVTEFTSTNGTFILLPSRSPGAVSSLANQTSQTLVALPSPVQGSSSSQTSAAANTLQSDSSQAVAPYPLLNLRATLQATE